MYGCNVRAGIGATP